MPSASVAQQAYRSLAPGRRATKGVGQAEKGYAMSTWPSRMRIKSSPSRATSASWTACAGPSGKAATMSSTRIAPPRSRKILKIRWNTSVWRAARRVVHRASRSWSISSSAVLISRIATSRPPPSTLVWEYDKVCSNSRLKAYFAEGKDNGRLGSYRDWPASEAYGRQHRDDPLLRTGGPAARSGAKSGRLSPLLDRAPQTSELCSPRPRAWVLHRRGPDPAYANGPAPAPDRP